MRLSWHSDLSLITASQWDVENETNRKKRSDNNIITYYYVHHEAVVYEQSEKMVFLFPVFANIVMQRVQKPISCLSVPSHPPTPKYNPTDEGGYVTPVQRKLPSKCVQRV